MTMAPTKPGARNPAPAAQLDGWLDRPLPQNPDCERAVLGAILINPNCFARVLPIVSTEDFFRDSHRLIFATMARLAEANREIDILTLKEELANRGEMDRAGGSAYISSLTDGIPNVAGAEQYAGIIREKSLLRQLIVLGNGLMRNALEQDEPGGMLASNLALRLSELAVAEDRGPQPIAAVMRRVVPALEERAERGEFITGIRTIRKVDGFTLGLQRGALSILGARTRVGKTVFANEIALGAARRGERVLFVELDMPERMLGERLLTNAAAVSSIKIRSGSGLSDHDWNAVTTASVDLGNLGDRLILDCATRDIGKLAAVIRRQSRSAGGLDLIIVDHIGHIRGGGRANDQRYRQIADVSSRLIEFAGEANAACLALVQLSRDAEQRAPELSDLRESGDLEQDARLIILLDRPFLRDETNDGGLPIPACELRMRVAKNEGDAGPWMSTHYDASLQRVTDEPERKCAAEACPGPEINQESERLFG